MGYLYVWLFFTVSPVVCQTVERSQSSHGNEKSEYICKTADNNSTEIFYHAGV